MVMSFETLCLPYWKDLMNFALRLTKGDTARSADIVQDSLVQALSAWDRFELDPDEPERCVRGWLYRIVSNTFTKDYHRQRVRRKALEDRVDDMVEGTTGAYTTTMRRSNSEVCYLERPEEPDTTISAEVTEAISRLSPEYREVVERLYFQGQSYDQIASEMGIPRGTVTSRLNRGRKALSKSLAGYAASAYGLTLDRPRKDALPVEPPEMPEAETDSIDRVMADDDVGAFAFVEASPDACAAW